MPKCSLLHASSISVKRGDRLILDAVSFDAGEGELVTLVGPNGAGKTTLLRCIAGLARFSGIVRINGLQTSDLSPKRLARMVAYVPQSIELSFPFSVREFVALGRYPHLSRAGAPSREDYAVVDAMIERVGATALAGQRVSSLSGGEKQRVLIASALAQEPKALLLDEPTAHLDPKRQHELISLMRELCDGGLSVVAVTHDLNGAARAADHVMALKLGRLYFQGSAEDFLRPEVLSGLYDERFTLHKGSGGAALVALAH